MRNVSDKRCRENKNTHFVFSDVFLFRKSCRLWDTVEKCCRSEQATDDNVAHAHLLLDTQGYKLIHKVCNTHCFSTPTMVARTRSTTPWHFSNRTINQISYFHTNKCTYSRYNELIPKQHPNELNPVFQLLHINNTHHNQHDNWSITPLHPASPLLTCALNGHLRR